MSCRPDASRAFALRPGTESPPLWEWLFAKWKDFAWLRLGKGPLPFPPDALVCLNQMAGTVEPLPA